MAREATTTTIEAEQAPRVIASVTAWPDEVRIDLYLDEDKVLTVEQARNLANTLLNAANEADSIEWADDDTSLLVEDKVDS